MFAYQEFQREGQENRNSVFLKEEHKQNAHQVVFLKILVMKQK